MIRISPASVRKICALSLTDGTTYGHDDGQLKKSDNRDVLRIPHRFFPTNVKAGLYVINELDESNVGTPTTT